MDDKYFDYDIKRISATTFGIKTTMTLTIDSEKWHCNVGDIVEYKEWSQCVVHKCKVRGAILNPVIDAYNVWLEKLETRALNIDDVLTVTEKAND